MRTIDATGGLIAALSIACGPGPTTPPAVGSCVEAVPDDSWFAGARRPQIDSATITELRRALIADTATIAQLKRDVVADTATFAALRRELTTDSATVAQLRPQTDAAPVRQRCRVARDGTSIGNDVIDWFFGF